MERLPLHVSHPTILSNPDRVQTEHLVLAVAVEVPEEVEVLVVEVPEEVVVEDVRKIIKLRTQFLFPGIRICEGFKYPLDSTIKNKSL